MYLRDFKSFLLFLVAFFFFILSKLLSEIENEEDEQNSVTEYPKVVNNCNERNFVAVISKSIFYIVVGP